VEEAILYYISSSVNHRKARIVKASNPPKIINTFIDTVIAVKGIDSNIHRGF